MTGRSNHIMRALRTMLDRRRRQAYVLLRRVLPVELSQRILVMNSNFGHDDWYASSQYDRWRN